MLNTYTVVGDIEGNEYIYKNVVSYITSHDENVVFLGDIYNPNKSNETINEILGLLNIYNVNINNIFNDCNVDDIKTTFRQLYINKHISFYNNTNRLLNEKIDDLMIEEQNNKQKLITDKFLFLLGNKEIDLIRDLSCFNSGEIVDDKLQIKTSYYFKNKRHINNLCFSMSELSTLFSYLSLCSHFVIINKTLITHMYVNAKIILNNNYNMINIDKTISGHNRCWGVYYDTNMPLLDIYVIDTTHENNDVINCYLNIVNDKITFNIIDIKASFVLKSKLCANQYFLKGSLDETNNVPICEYCEKIKRNNIYDIY